MNRLPQIQKLVALLAKTKLLDLHVDDLSNDAHPSHYDSTSVYDMVIFRRLSNRIERQDHSQDQSFFSRIDTKAVGFLVFDRLLISVHPTGCMTGLQTIRRHLNDARHDVDSDGMTRTRLPSSPADLMLRMVNNMVDSYLDLRKELTFQLDQWQTSLLEGSHFNDWKSWMQARGSLHMLEDLCEEQQDAMQEWLDNWNDQPVTLAQREDRDYLIARSRDILEHINRVLHHVQRLLQTAETAVQIHFSAQGHRANDIMRTLTALTAIFLPLNLITGFFGMNFQNFPWIKEDNGIWWASASMIFIGLVLGLFFYKKRYIGTRKNK